MLAEPHAGRPKGPFASCRGLARLLRALRRAGHRKGFDAEAPPVEDEGRLQQPPEDRAQARLDVNGVEREGWRVGGGSQSEDAWHAVDFERRRRA